MEFVVEGNTVLPTQQVERAVYRFLGPGRRFADVEGARKALEETYRSGGFGFTVVDIPEQRADSGVIRLNVAEGRIARTRVTGSRYFSQGWILQRVDNATEGQVPHLPTLQAQLVEVNRTADRRVTPLLRPGREAGTTEVDLEVKDQLPLHASVELNNKSSPNTSETRLQASFSWDNLFQRDHSIGLQGVVSPEKRSDVQVLSLSYTVPLGAGGLESLVVSATRSDSEVVAGVADTTLFGKGNLFSLRRSFVMDLREGRFHLLTLGLDYKDMEDTVAAGAGAGFATPIKYMPLSAAWTGVFRNGSQEWQLGSTVSLGLRGLVNEQQQFSDKRFRASATYGLLKLEARHNRTLPWAGLRLRAQFESQLATEPLISNEQFVIGGVDSVRGYREAVAVGDYGLRGSLQLASPELAPLLGWKLLSALTVHGFVDAARAELHRPLPGQGRRYRLAGAGFGMQVAAAGNWPLRLALDFGWPLRKQGEAGKDGLRVHASAAIGF